jgi:hypothetical protein
MRKVICLHAVSLDGYYTGQEHNVMVLELDGAFDRLLAAQAAACDDRGSTREVRSWSR